MNEFYYRAVTVQTQGMPMVTPGCPADPEMRNVYFCPDSGMVLISYPDRIRAEHVSRLSYGTAELSVEYDPASVPINIGEVHDEHNKRADKIKSLMKEQGLE